MDVNEEKESRPSPEQGTELPQKLPEAWQRFLEAIQRHYGNPPTK
ncbi:MAG: hypothetical protein K0R47_1604 [Brevibacillus sp.]|jgi:hypothetical protein|nr:hypothetical protein [Brevibacillus sp.]